MDSFFQFLNQLIAPVKECFFLNISFQFHQLYVTQILGTVTTLALIAAAAWVVYNALIFVRMAQSYEGYIRELRDLTNNGYGPLSESEARKTRDILVALISEDKKRKMGQT